LIVEGQLDCDVSQLLNRRGAARILVPDEADRHVRPFGMDVVHTFFSAAA
jgi:hypothetical protein